MKHTENHLKRLVLSVIFTHRYLTAALAGVILFSLILGILPPLVLQRAIDSLTAGDATEQSMLLWGMAYAALTALSGLSDAAKESCITCFGQTVTHHIRSALADKLERLPASYFIEQEAGRVTSLFVNDVDTIEALFDSGIISMAVDACRILSILYAVFLLSPGLFLLLLIALPLLFLLTRVFQKRMLKAQIENRKALAGTNSLIPETYANIRTIRLIGCEDFAKKRYTSSLVQSFKAMEKTNFYDSIYSPIIITISAVLIALITILSINPSAGALFSMTAGTAATLIAYVGKIFSPLESMGMEIENIQSAMAGAHRIQEFLEEKEMVPPPMVQGHCHIPLEINTISFSYEKGNPIFKDFSLTVKAGEKVTIAGRTGSGKSTLFKLITGLYQAEKGSIAVFGKSPLSIPPEKRREIFGIVSQSFPPVSGTVRGQITLGDRRISDDQITAALHLTGLYEVCMNLPLKLDTPFKEGLFSQGGLQLLSIARAIVLDPPLLLLDEMNAHLDSLTEQKVMDALLRVSKEKTVLSIAHRMEGKLSGRIVHIRGTHG